MKTKCLICLALLPWALFGCKELEQDLVEEAAAPRFSIRAVISQDSETKTILDPTGKVLWGEEDCIGLYIDGATSPTLFTLTEGAGTTSGVFSGPGSGSDYIGVYPGGIAGDAQGSSVRLTLPAVQQYVQGSFGEGAAPMMAQGDNNALVFKNLCSVVKISLTGHHQVTDLVFEANDPSVKVSGEATAYMDAAAVPVLVMDESGSNTLTLETGGILLKDDVATDFYLALPPQTYTGGFKLTVNTSTGSMTKELATDFTLERSRIHAATPFSIRLDNGIEPSTFLEGLGTEQSPFLISSLPDLLLFQAAVNSVNGEIATPTGESVAAASAYYRLTTALDLSPVCGEALGRNWTPVGNSFCGVFDGGGYQISSLYIDDADATYQGFFGEVPDASIHDLSVRGHVYAVNYVALVAATAGHIIDCSSYGDVSGRTYVGGITAEVPFGGEVVGCLNMAAVSGTSICGGIAGVSNFIIRDDINAGTVNCDGYGYYTGGIVGYQNYGTLSNCSNIGDVSGYARVGGISGYSRQNARLLNSVNYNRVYASGGRVGGICGECYTWSNYDTAIYNCVNVGPVVVEADGDYAEAAGGVCGYNGSTIRSCYWLYDTAAAAGMQQGIGVNEGLTSGNFALTTAQMQGEGLPYPLYTASDGGTFTYLVKALNAWAYENLSEYPELKAWELSSGGVYGGYPVVTAAVPDYPDTDDVQDFFAVIPSEVTVAGTGGTFTVTIYANVSFEVSSQPDWITEEAVSHPDDNTWTYTYSASVNPDAEQQRTGAIVYCDSRSVCTPVNVVQTTGPDYYVSVDYSADGEVTVLQTASEGAGVNLVLMGDAFSDRQIADGTYAAVMNKMADAFFGEEPYASYRNLFNVSYVNVVSAVEGYENAGQRLSTWFGGGTYVGGDNGLCMDYALSAVDANDMDNTLIIVAMNSATYAGTCWMYYPSGGDYGCGTSVAYFPLGTDDEMLAQLVHHEAGGHGFAKLADEYAYQSMGAIPDDVKAGREQLFPYGWWKNCDFTDDRDEVKWAHFLADNRYQYDGLGCFEGAFTYWTGAWRPTDNSIMRYNYGGYNAPSREAIWIRIHKLAYGDAWEYNYEDFVSYDEKNRRTSAGAFGGEPPFYVPETPLHAPVETGMTWREAWLAGSR